jgi:phosphoglycolate phosphatase
MDGTLIDSREDITISINYVRELNHNLPPLNEEFVVHAINLQERNLPFLFYGTKNYEERDRTVFEKHYYQQCIKHTYLYDGIYELLVALKKGGVDMYVATNAPSLFAKRMLQHLKVLDMFEMVVGADMVKVSKPNPEMIHKILDDKNYNKNTHKAWMVGDSSKDIDAAINADINGIFVLWGFSNKSEYNCNVTHPKEIYSIVL